ncbi:MAG: hypothetical protein LBD67_02060 [Candidatus Accumulibacter sp.]|nr:hypothetical protein [Accumulibacter sp.]
MLSLSKQERTLCLSSPYPSTSFLRQAQDGAGRSRMNGLESRRYLETVEFLPHPACP